ncbi:FAD-binding oxidoreductase [Micromonospora sp. KLBMP9576]|uniref:FAD-binding oxidoreductase n=1 Tax=Micromonospora sp. KLBMP9576 TaxID=3424769 RepID=UPI003D8DC512
MSIVAAWEAAVDKAVEKGTDDFWCTLEDRRPGLLPERVAPLLFAALGRLTVGGDDPAGRAALLAVLGCAYRQLGLLTHADTIGDALLAAVARYARPMWTSQLTDAWERAGRRAAEAVRRATACAGDGPAWWPAEVIAHDRPCDTIAILTVRPRQRLPHRPGQAVPVSTPRRPGRWRWLSPANAPRPDGTVELHVRAIAAGAVAHSLVHDVRPGELVWLGPPRDAGLGLDPSTIPSC